MPKQCFHRVGSLCLPCATSSLPLSAMHNSVCKFAMSVTSPCATSFGFLLRAFIAPYLPASSAKSLRARLLLCLTSCTSSHVRCHRTGSSGPRAGKVQSSRSWIRSDRGIAGNEEPQRNLIASNWVKVENAAVKLGGIGRADSCRDLFVLSELLLKNHLQIFFVSL